MQIQIMAAKEGAPVLYRNVFHAGYVILKTQGIRGAYQGLSATITRNIPACAVYFCKLNIFLETFSDFLKNETF